MTDAFQYDELPRDYTRILTIDYTSNTLMCTLETFPDDQLPPFCALSYAWGNEGPTASILCNGKTFHLTPHLYSGLLAIARLECKTEHAVKLWADAVCLNQRDNAEKSIHVPKMATIYRSAHDVTIWLGPERENSNLVMNQRRIEQITSAVCNIEGRLAYSELIDRGLPRATDPFWPAMGKLCQRGWFLRLWVVQEVVLARETFVICGDRMASYDSLAMMMVLLTSQSCSGLILKNLELEAEQVGGLLTLSTHMIMQEIVARGGGLTARLLDFMRRKLVSKRVDRVYGALSLLEPELRDAITVDYSYEDSTWWKPYLQLGACLVVRDASLRLLSCAPSKERPEGLPSWCPNFNSESADHQQVLGIVGYRAGYIQEADRKSEIEVLPNDNIKAPGFEIDQVEAVVDFSWPSPESDPKQSWSEEADRFLEWEERCLELSRQAYGCDVDETTGDVFVHEAHWRTLIVDAYENTALGVSTRSSPVPPAYKDSYLGLKQVWRSGRDNEPWVNAMPDGPTRQYEQQLHFTRSMKFFKTKNRIGRGPSNIRIGDRVVALYSAGPLFVLRDEPDEGCMRLVGNAYVYGCMSLQTMRDAGIESRRDFIIG